MSKNPRPAIHKHTAFLDKVHRLFDHPFVFNAWQAVGDSGKGRQIRRFLREVSVSSVLDVGCGTGNWASVTDGRYLGVDISSEFIAAARDRYRDDPQKEFRHLDATVEDVPGHFDLMQLISVLHHLSDDQVRRLIGRVAPRIDYLFVLDLYPVPWNPISRFLYRADRGDHIRTPAEQKRLIESSADLRLVREDDYFAPPGLYRHTLLLYASRGV